MCRQYALKSGYNTRESSESFQSFHEYLKQDFWSNHGVLDVHIIVSWILICNILNFVNLNIAFFTIFNKFNKHSVILTK